MIHVIHAGDIVFVRFPDLPGLAPGKKFRPCIVLGREVSGELCLAYGTSQHLDERHRGEFLVTPSDQEFEKTGLRTATKFCLQCRAVVPETRSYFQQEAGVACGQVEGELLKRMFLAARELRLV